MKLWQGNVFTHVCQSLCSQGGLCPSMYYRSMIGRSVSGGSLSGGGLCSGWSLSRGFLSRGISVQGGLCLVGSVQEVSVQRGLCLGESVWEVGGTLYRGLYPGRSPDRDPRTVMRGQYASYWKAFLSLMFSSSPPLSVIRS